jgi:hypothetical protein
LTFNIRLLLLLLLPRPRFHPAGERLTRTGLVDTAVPRIHNFCSIAQMLLVSSK